MRPSFLEHQARLGISVHLGGCPRRRLLSLHVAGGRRCWNRLWHRHRARLIAAPTAVVVGVVPLAADDRMGAPTGARGRCRDRVSTPSPTCSHAVRGRPVRRRDRGVSLSFVDDKEQRSRDGRVKSRRAGRPQRGFLLTETPIRAWPGSPANRHRDGDAAVWGRCGRDPASRSGSSGRTGSTPPESSATASAGSGCLAWPPDRRVPRCSTFVIREPARCSM